jgi:hypothetical protein
VFTKEIEATAPASTERLCMQWQRKKDVTSRRLRGATDREVPRQPGDPQRLAGADCPWQSSRTLIVPRACRWRTRTLLSIASPTSLTAKKDALRFAENARYQSRLASSLRRRQEAMHGTVLVDKPFPDEPPLEQIYNDLLIGDVETVAEKLVAEIRATHPVHVCFSFKVGATPHKAAMRSMELMMTEVKPRVERAVGSPAHEAAE